MIALLRAPSAAVRLKAAEKLVQLVDEELREPRKSRMVWSKSASRRGDVYSAWGTQTARAGRG